MEATTEALKANAGYGVKTVAAWIAERDVDAAGNGEKAGWKQYLALCLMAIAKGMTKKELVEMVFGKGGKPSKTFNNMWSIAEKCRATIVTFTNRTWDDVRGKGMQDAFDMTIEMINGHMRALEVGGKNAYDPICNLTLSEVTAKREADKARKAAEEEEARKAEEAKKDEKSDNGNSEAEAKRKAADKQERDVVQEALALLANANRQETLAVIAAMQAKLTASDVVEVINTMLESLPFDEAANVADMAASRKAAIAPQVAKPAKKAAA